MKKNGHNNANLQTIKQNYENLHLTKQVNTKHDCQHKQQNKMYVMKYSKKTKTKLVQQKPQFTDNHEINKKQQSKNKNDK